MKKEYKCTDCVHYDVCQMHYRQKCELAYDTKKEINYAMRQAQKNSHICELFKNRSKYMELPTNLKKGDRVYFIYEEKGKFEVSNPSIVSAVMKEGFFTFGNIYCTKEDEFDAYRDDFNYYSEIGEICFYTKKEAQKAVDKKNKKEKR